MHGREQSVPALVDKMPCEKCGLREIVETRPDRRQYYVVRGH